MSKTRMSTAKIKEQIIRDSKETSERILTVAENTREIGFHIDDTLSHQGDQFRNIRRVLTETQSKQEKAKQHLAGIESIAGNIANKASLPYGNNAENTDKIFDKERKKREKEKKRIASAVHSQTTKWIDKTSLDPVDQNVEAISAVVDDLKVLVLQQSYELDDHNHQLKIIDKQICNTKDTMNGLMQRTRRI